ncbi:MAG: dethiobiotin synthase [Phascolarctobacterium sp.]|nr:MAG: dethiobiotin synthase [Phascolarctobacterium sp.]
MKAIGITATDTEFGKTVVSSCLAAGFKQLGLDTGVFKPAASGCVRTAEGKLVSEDAEMLMKGAGLPQAEHDKVVPYVLEAALAPAKASKLAGISLDSSVMEQAARRMIAAHEVTVVEGVGGISAPLTDDYLVKDFFKALGLPVIIVVKPLLGNVNHAVLSAYYAQHEGLDVLGFIVNGWDEAHAGVLERSNLYYYEKLTGLPVLGKLPVLDKALFSGSSMEEAGKIAVENIDLKRIYNMLGDGKRE